MIELQARIKRESCLDEDVLAAFQSARCNLSVGRIYTDGIVKHGLLAAWDWGYTDHANKAATQGEFDVIKGNRLLDAIPPCSSKTCA